MPTHRRPVQGTASKVLAALAELPAAGCVPAALVPGPAYATDIGERAVLAVMPASCLEGTR